MPTIPPNDPRLASLKHEIDELRREIRLLKEKPQAEDNPDQRRREIIFSTSGAVDLIRTPCYRVKDFAGTIHRVDVDVDNVTSGEGNRYFAVLVNEVPRAEVYLLNGEKDQTILDLAIEVYEEDRIAIQWMGLGESTITGCAITLVMMVVDGENLE